MLHQSTAVVQGPGEVLASFPLRLRNTGPLSSSSPDYRYKATVVSLLAAPEEIQESGYELTMALNFAPGEETYSTYFQDPFGPRSAPLAMADRLDVYNAKAKSAYPYLSRLPSVRYAKEDSVRGRFVVTLPPMSGIHTSSVGFWDTLGFEQDSYQSFPDSRMKNAPQVTALAFGFVNLEPVEVEVVGKEMGNTEPLGPMYAVFGGVAKQIHLELRFLQVELPLALARKRPMNRTQIADCLATVLDDGLRLLNLDPSAISVETAGKYLVLRSKEFTLPGVDPDEPPAVIAMTFSTELTEFLQLEQDNIYFPLSSTDTRTYELKPRDEPDFDPLDPFYPLTLLLQQGQAINYVEGRGFSSILTLMRGKEDFVGEGVVISGQCDQLVVRFLDKLLRPVRLRDRSTTFVLTLELTPVD